MTAAGRAVVIGTISIDLVASAPDAPTAQVAVGNSGANIAVRLAAAGWDVEMVALIGPDPAGDLICADLERWGVGTRGIVRRPGYLSPRVFQVAGGIDAGVSSLLFECPRCGEPRGHLLEVPAPGELPDDVRAAAAAADLVVADMTGEVPAELASVTAGLVWFEASLREATEPAIAAQAALSDVVKVSSEDVEHYASALTADRPGLQIVTEGAGGLRSRRRMSGTWGDWITLPSALDRPPVDTIGAGDAFTAAASAGLAVGVDVGRALEDGARAAAQACLSSGARGDMLAPGAGASSWLRDDVPFQCGWCDMRFGA